MMLCGILTVLPSCETYRYMRDPDAAKRSEALERSALLVESEAGAPTDGEAGQSLPNSGPAAFYNEFPEGTNPEPPREVTPVETQTPEEYDRWVHGPDGLLVPASSLKNDNAAAADDDASVDADE